MFSGQRVFIEETELAGDGTILEHADLECQQDTALHPDVCFPALRCLLGRPEFPAVKTIPQGLNDRHPVAARNFRREAQQLFDLFRQVHTVCSNPDCSSTWASLSRFAVPILTSGSL